VNSELGLTIKNLLLKNDGMMVDKAYYKRKE